jgi:hypothetical protein
MLKLFAMACVVVLACVAQAQAGCGSSSNGCGTSSSRGCNVSNSATRARNQDLLQAPAAPTLPATEARQKSRASERRLLAAKAFCAPMDEAREFCAPMEEIARPSLSREAARFLAVR